MSRDKGYDNTMIVWHSKLDVQICIKTNYFVILRPSFVGPLDGTFLQSGTPWILMKS